MVSHTGAAIARFTALRTMAQSFIKACGQSIKRKSVWPHAFRRYGSGLGLTLVHFCIKGFSSDLMPVYFLLCNITTSVLAMLLHFSFYYHWYQHMISASGLHKT
jgi:hypothetical protein